jgi:hypothetical protein
MTDIIIATYKKKEEIQDQIDKIEANTSEKHRIIATCQPLSAAKNRNYGLSFANSSIIIMMDDDIIGFYEGWLTDLIHPFEIYPNCILTSARLFDRNKNIIHMMGANGIPSTNGFYKSNKFFNDKFYRVATACIAFRKNTVRYNEDFIGSGYEDTSYMNRLNIAFPNSYMMINNNCKLIHLNEEKEQGGKNFEHNKKTYLKEFPDDPSVINQRDWTKRKI